MRRSRNATRAARGPLAAPAQCSRPAPRFHRPLNYPPVGRITPILALASVCKCRLHKMLGAIENFSSLGRKIPALAATLLTAMAQSHASNRDQDSATSLDRASWHALLAVHDRWLRTVALARLREREAADEVMQEVALAVVRRSAPVVDSTRIAPWLYRLLIQQIFLYRRKCGRRRKLTQRFQERVRIEEHDVKSPDPAEWLLSTEQRAEVRKALSALPHKDAEILLLKYTEGWSYHQIAAHLGIGHSAVEARLHRARQRMRALLTEPAVAARNP